MTVNNPVWTCSHRFAPKPVAFIRAENVVQRSPPRLDESNRYPITTWLSKQEMREPVRYVPLTYAISVTGFIPCALAPLISFEKHKKVFQWHRASAVIALSFLCRVVIPSTSNPSFWSDPLSPRGSAPLLFPPPGTRERWKHGLVGSMATGALVGYNYRRMFGRDRFLLPLIIVGRIRGGALQLVANPPRRACGTCPFSEHASAASSQGLCRSMSAFNPGPESTIFVS
ncbi:hypothetical protein V8E36_008853 [Tilletia maclaganii]